MAPTLKPVSGTLQTAEIVSAGLTELQALVGVAEMAETLARIILGTFEDYYTRSRKIPWQGQAGLRGTGLAAGY